MIKKLLFSLTLTLFFLNVNSQNNQVWTKHNNLAKIAIDKSAARDNFPKVFQLFDLNISPLRQELFSIVNNVGKNATIITLPNADGQMELFEVNDASNFDPELQAKYPQIRAYSGKGITDRYATLKLSISPQGIQTIVFRTDRENEFIEPYSEDHSVYAVFKSQKNKNTGWACSTAEEKSVMETTFKSATGSNSVQSSAGQLKVIRLALSCNAEYANYFGATSAAQVALVLTAFNNTLTRCNGIYEKDLGVHMNLVASTTNVIYYIASSDPYTSLANWNTQLQIALNTTLTGVGTAIAANNAAYDIGHLFGKTGGGGNAGCIGCICVDGVAAGTGGTKGRGITSPSNGIPSGDTFDIDYVVHEMGHQMGANHTFSNSNEGAGVNKEVGSGITIMGYAGITNQDVAANSIDIFHQTSIEQIQNNLAGRTCIVSTNLVDNATPIVLPVSDYTIPFSTPFVLTGAATDANETDALTYCWEQNDDGGANTGANSSASETKTLGPNFLSWSPKASPSRYFPKIESVVANSTTTSEVGGTAGFLSEALSSVSRVLNFRLTVRDNAPYRATAPVKVGQTNYTDMKVNVTSAAGPFVVNAPNSAVSWVVGSNQIVTWAVAGTTANNVNAAYVDVFLSMDGGYTYPVQLASKVPNNGSATITVPNNIGSSNRIMVKGYKHVFFDISNVNFTITAPTSSFAIAYNGLAEQQNKQACQGGSAAYTIPYTAYAGFTGTTTFTAGTLPAGVAATFVPSSFSASGTATMNGTISASVSPGVYPIIVSATSGATVKTATFYLEVFISNFGIQALTSPADLTVALSPGSVNLTWPSNTAATSYDVQIGTTPFFTTIVRSVNVTTNSYTAINLSQATDYHWRVMPRNPTCSGTYSPTFRFTTGQLICSTQMATDTPVDIPIVANTIPFYSSINLTSANLVTDVNVTVDISHTWVNDMTISLISPTGTEIQLVSRPCTNASLLDITATFDDSGITLVCATNPAISGTVKPVQLLSGFNGQPINGVWKLKVVDPYNEDGGAINSWSLNICAMASPLGVVDNSLANFTLYPNPNKGNFTVQFDSNTNNDIAITVHDMRGRLILNNTYNNTGLFSQNVQLDTIQSGVYLVTVQDGYRKVVKRIVIE